MFVAETMLSVDETVVALDAAQAVCDLPMICTLSLEADGSAMYGGNAVEAVLTLQEMGAAAVGLNCSVGPDQLEAVVASMKRSGKLFRSSRNQTQACRLSMTKAKLITI